MFNNTALMSELDAINYCMTAVGQNPVTSYIDTKNRLVSRIMTALTYSANQLQSRGWSWNTIYNWTGQLNTDGYIELPDAVMRAGIADPLSPRTAPSSRASRSRAVSIRLINGKPYLYNNDEATFVWKIAPVLQLTINVEFPDLPPAARQFIASTAAGSINAQYLNDPMVAQHQKEMRTEALITLEQHEDEATGHHNRTGGSPNMGGWR